MDYPGKKFRNITEVSISQAERNPQMGAIDKQPAAAHFGGDMEGCAWSQHAFAQLIAIAIADVRFAYQVLQLARTQRHDTPPSGSDGGG